MPDRPGVIALVAALRDLAADYNAVQVSAVYRLPEGEGTSRGAQFLQVRVTGDLVTIEDDRGNLVSVPPPEAS